MPIPALMSRPTTASPSEAQNSHQIGPRASARPPTRKASMISDTATQETVRPWKEGNETGVPGTWDTNGATCWPPEAAVPVLTAPDPGPATEPLAELAVADPTCFAMRAAPLLPLVVMPIIVVKRWAACTPGPEDGSRRLSTRRLPLATTTRWPPVPGQSGRQARFRPGSRLPCQYQERGLPLCRCTNWERHAVAASAGSRCWQE